MPEVITIRRRLVPLNYIALVEPFDPAQSRIQTDKDFRARVVMIDRESVLTEDTSAAFAEAHGSRMLPDEGVAVSPAIHFGVECFEPAEGFKPTRPYRSRLVWRDQDGNTQSKLLLGEPEAVLAVAVQGEPAPNGLEDNAGAPPPRAPTRRRPRRANRRSPVPNPV